MNPAPEKEILATNLAVKKFSHELFSQTLYPLIFTSGLLILYWGGVFFLSHYYPTPLVKDTYLIANKILQILVTGGIYWLLIKAIDQLNKYLYFYLNKNGYKITSLTLTFLMSSLKIILLLGFINLIISMLPVPIELIYLTEKLVGTLIIAAIAWILIKLTNFLEQMILFRYNITNEENLFAHKVHTQITLLKRVVMSVIAVLTIGAILMQFSNVRELGASILASAGIATVIVGLAIQKFLTALIMGLQIALNQPIKINDYVVIENEFGQIEEITLYYVVVRVWDLRKIIVPINYILEKPFQNLSRGSKNLLGTIFMYFDYSLPIDELRTELNNIVNKSHFSDKEICLLQISDCKESTIELRALVSAKNPGNL